MTSGSHLRKSGRQEPVANSLVCQQSSRKAGQGDKLHFQEGGAVGGDTPLPVSWGERERDATAKAVLVK